MMGGRLKLARRMKPRRPRPDADAVSPRQIYYVGVATGSLFMTASCETRTFCAPLRKTDQRQARAWSSARFLRNQSSDVRNAVAPQTGGWIETLPPF